MTGIEMQWIWNFTYAVGVGLVVYGLILLLPAIGAAAHNLRDRLKKDS
ncbi:hypothetical protein GS982_01880 [Rhodococcus hoagii]|uniref:Uncharacterized protein n=1 Tax=Rhodococcus hoagii TaxID=43767 RepID=A0A9Q4ZIV3_RHOHA|nr:hypothetical protein [Prescottella equi]MBM4707825.1 hypothetical protein [Prescottella equi]NKT77347.1 hypothetical protein [Prescottella equi]NKZ81132.1 hypothetical protein [Prescottella equi]